MISIQCLVVDVWILFYLLTFFLATILTGVVGL